MTTVASGALYFGTGGSGDCHRDKSQRGDQSGEEYGTQQMRGAQSEDSVGSHSIFISFTKFVEMVHHQDTVQYSHTEQGDETDSCRDAERESAQPEGYDTSDK